jgi:8-amino-7-oxononanoate synthase
LGSGLPERTFRLLWKQLTESVNSIKTSLDDWLATAAMQRRSNHLQRNRKVLRADGQMRVLLAGQCLIDFSSNDYLGLAHDNSLSEAVANAASQYGVGSGASALVTGYRDVHESLEKELAQFLQRDRVLLCSSGYQANLAVLGSLASRADTIIQDKLCHASLIDGAKLSGAKLLRYPHLDMEGLGRQLQRATSGNTLVVSDGIFSMDGDPAPLSKLSELAGAYKAWLMVDDAHGIGVVGPEGRGCVASAGLGQEQVPVLTGTLGKAFGCAGAFIAGSEALIDHIVNEGRSYLFTTAISPLLAEAGRAALKLVQANRWRRDKLNEHISQFRVSAKTLGLELMDSDTPIQPLMVGDAAASMRVSEALLKKGFLVAAIRPPTVPAGSSRLRITLSAAHETGQIEQLLQALSECVNEQ